MGWNRAKCCFTKKSYLNLETRNSNISIRNMEVSALKAALKELKACAFGEHDLGVRCSKVGTALYQPTLLFLN